METSKIKEAPQKFFSVFFSHPPARRSRLLRMCGLPNDLKEILYFMTEESELENKHIDTAIYRYVCFLTLIYSIYIIYLYTNYISIITNKNSLY